MKRWKYSEVTEKVLWDFTYTNALMIKARMPGQVLTAEMGVLEVKSVLFLGRRREEGIEQVKLFFV